MTERDVIIYERRKGGATLRTLAAEFGISKQRIQQIIKEEEWRVKQASHWRGQFSTRLTNCLWQIHGPDFYELPEAEAARTAAAIEGRLYLKHPYFGRQMLAELTAWLQRFGHWRPTQNEAEMFDMLGR